MALNDGPKCFVHRLGDWQRGRGPLYARLAEAVRVGVADGVIPVGSLLPAERVLADCLAVSRTTVATAYGLLEEEGWLERKRGSGTRVRRPPERLGADGLAVPSSEGAATEMLLGEFAGMIDLTVSGFSGAQGLDADTLAISGAEAQRLLTGCVGYFPSGLPQLRERIAVWLSEQGLPTSSSQIVVTSGAQQAIGLVAALVLEPGDYVVLENLTYYGAMDVFRSRGARLIPVPLDGGGVDTEALADAVAARSPALVYVVPTCNNPTGTILSSGRRHSLARLAEDFDGFLVEDQVLAPLLYDDEIPRAIASLTDAESVITIGSTSKLFWAGLRVGWVRGPEPFVNRLARLKVVADLGSSLPSQLIASRLLLGAGEMQERRRRQLRERLADLARLLGELLPSWELRPPAGGPFAWVKLPKGDADRLAQISQRYGVRIMPGSTLSVDGSHANHVRLPLTPDTETLAAGIRRLAEAWKAYDTPAARRSAEPQVIV